jgi:hypothetical protein
VSLSLTLDCTKGYKINETEEVLVVSLTMTGGDVAVLNIHEAKGRVLLNGQWKGFNFDGVDWLMIGIAGRHL